MEIRLIFQGNRAMTTQWSTKAFGREDSFANLLADPLLDCVVVLMQGKNHFGDRVYSYLKLPPADLKLVQESIFTLPNFNPSDYGTVVAAGKGDPPHDIRTELKGVYTVLEFGENNAKVAAPPPAQKAWDDF